jgi:large subunit ribosomal protein L25
MAATTASTTTLQATPRPIEGSRSVRRLRRSGRVPGVLYGGEGEAVAFSVDERELRHALAAAGAVVELSLGSETASAVLKDVQRHPVRGETMHVDFLRVDLDQPIQATVALHLEGADEAPGVVEGGVLEQVTREVTIEALPREIPEQLTYDVSHMEILGTEHLSAVTAPRGVTIVDDGELVIATITPPTLEVASDEEIEQETELVGEGEGITADEAHEESLDVPETEGGGQSSPDTASE